MMSYLDYFKKNFEEYDWLTQLYYQAAMEVFQSIKTLKKTLMNFDSRYHHLQPLQEQNSYLSLIEALILLATLR